MAGISLLPVPLPSRHHVSCNIGTFPLARCCYSLLLQLGDIVFKLAIMLELSTDGHAADCKVDLGLM
jgi:hypothetical protein